jgi:hypothetical protein
MEMEIVILFFSVTIFVLFMLLVLTALVILIVSLQLRSLAQVSGLIRLAELYPADHQPEGLKYTGQTVQVGAVRYRRCVTVCISPQGFYLSVQPKLVKYPPVLIPWGEIKKIRETRLYWQRAMLLSIGEPRVATVRVLIKLFKVIQPHLNPSGL